MPREDYILRPNQEKDKIYLKIDDLFRQGKKVSVREHNSGFPAVKVDCGDIHILTDVLSLEEWFGKKKRIIDAIRDTIDEAAQVHGEIRSVDYDMIAEKIINAAPEIYAHDVAVARLCNWSGVERR